MSDETSRREAVGVSDWPVTSLKVRPGTWRRFKAACSLKGVLMSEVIDGLCRRWSDTVLTDHKQEGEKKE